MFALKKSSRGVKFDQKALSVGLLSFVHNCKGGMGLSERIWHSKNLQ